MELEESLEYTIKILKEMISYPTVSPSGENYREFVEFMKEELEDIADEIKIIIVPREYQEKNCPQASEKPRYILYARFNGSGESVLHFNGHYDVVPGGQGWRVTSPFKPVVRDGRLYGRGAVDMKGGLATVIGALRKARRNNKDFYHTVELAIVPDEEIGGECGTGYLVKEVLEKPPEYVIIPEPSGLDHPWHGHKGLVWARIKVKGRNAHASTPWRGVNAFLLAAKLALELQKAYIPILSSRKSKYKTIPEESMYPTISIGGEAGVTGGGKTNQVPGEFYFTIDRRLIPEESVSSVKSELESLIRWLSVGEGGYEYEVEYTATMEPAINDPGILYEALRRAGSSVGVEIGEPVVCPGGLDLRYYTSIGSKTLSYGPSGETAHSPDENVSIEELEALVNIFYKITTSDDAWVKR